MRRATDGGADDDVLHYGVAVDLQVLDAACGSRIRGDAPDVTATAGLTWGFVYGETR